LRSTNDLQEIVFDDDGCHSEIFEDIAAKNEAMIYISRGCQSLRNESLLEI
jgi:hypothetical protein